MKLSIALAGALVLGASLTVQAAPADETAPYGKRVESIQAVAESRAGSFDVYIDTPTGFAFVNTPSGWKFTRNVLDGSAAASGKNGAVAKF